MNENVKILGGFVLKSSRFSDMNVYHSSWSKQKHTESKSISFPNDQSLFSIAENDSDGNAEKMQKGQCDLCLSHASMSMIL